MSDTVIKVENLSKSYTINHQSGERYTALRDVLTNGVKEFGNRLLSRDATRNTQHASTEEFWALNDVSFEVKQGERVGIIGRNGAGKSTLLKILSRITEPTKGRVHIKGRVASLLEVGTGFHPELTGRENISLNGAILGMSRVEIRRKFDEIVAFAEVEKFLDTPVKRYSSGMYVRLAFAVAAHLEPEVLVVDEVLAVGDAAFQKKCLGKMEDVGREGRTVLFVSHNMQAVLRLCSKGLYLDRGRLLGMGSIKQVSNLYLDSSRASQHQEMDLSSLPRPHFIASSLFRLNRIKLLGGDENGCYKIRDPLRFEIEYTNREPIDGLRIGLGINTILGQRLCTFHTVPQNHFIRNGCDRIYLDVDTSLLKPGIYTIDIGARSGKTSYDALSQVISFEILPFIANTTVEIDDDDNEGLISLQHNFLSDLPASEN